MEPWLHSTLLEPALPPYCTPTNDFLLRFSSVFHVCVPTPLAFTSNLLGGLSILAWLFAQLPQIIKNARIQSTAGLSIFFLVEWCLGDFSNLLGALFTHQAPWQVAIGCYYVFVDVCLVGQWVWYEGLKHGSPVLRVWRKRRGDADGNLDGADERGNIEPMRVNGETPHPTRPRVIFRTPTFQRDEKDEKLTPSSSSRSPTIHRLGAPSNSPCPSPSPRTILFLACLIVMAQAKPLPSSPSAILSPTNSTPSTPLENAGTLLSWTSTALYLASRAPQLLQNHRRKSVAGLSPLLFLAAFCGNLFYSSALLTNPCAWSDFQPYGGHGWVGEAGSDMWEWRMAAMPFWLGAAGVLGMDAAMGVQFWVYGRSGEEEEGLVVLERGDGEESRRGKWHWRRVSGWMRGWVPVGIRDVEGRDERARLLAERRGEGGYGGL
ncbi:unnamed protein product [Zymoseptoria tritici ST99CH_1E4]|uniref:PQ loop repeat protein n=1 Tax=Zymoseptoria tritici ST99CH_1E4 TaxID=1276532 RepID=A0A2H1FX37_ZYMTR|nr:unnamed protein product [Zymoseptoria tritici ST99CH_1E4]